MVEAMIQLAEGLGMTPLAEGIETEGELAFLRGAGCRSPRASSSLARSRAEESPG